MAFQIELVETAYPGRTADIEDVYETKEAAIERARRINGDAWAKRTSGVVNKRIVVVPVNKYREQIGPVVWRSGEFESN